jgi:hypothetical protein
MLYEQRMRLRNGMISIKYKNILRLNSRDRIFLFQTVRIITIFSILILLLGIVNNNQFLSLIHGAPNVWTKCQKESL